uniref:Uncharacterized protein n=1 Tax=Cacopsylla melanoneura TaxID=428564 RepID=A0A8D8YG17_9HEMI
MPTSTRNGYQHKTGVNQKAKSLHPVRNHRPTPAHPRATPTTPMGPPRPARTRRTRRSSRSGRQVSAITDSRQSRTHPTTGLRPAVFPNHPAMHLIPPPVEL